ncbi:unnamed protein product [Spirodela intermedia]|uniref:Uncharacterized protein n=1 Tax=Spirodela intermedia TaxID=51605 RepID=A0A7I8LGN2_SPIIN|nr:unnamed protein product [Spirodela intermedia]
MESSQQPHFGAAQPSLPAPTAAAERPDSTAIPMPPTDGAASSSKLSVLGRFHAGYFRISLSLCGQALLWKTLTEPSVANSFALRHAVRALPSAAFHLLWSLALATLVLFCLLYALRCIFHFDSVKAEYYDHVGVNYFFAPWISGLLLLQCSPFFLPGTKPYVALWWVFSTPVLALDVKIYGQWITKGKKFLTLVANPTSQLSVIGNLIGARAAAQMGRQESAVFMFTLGMSHYLVLFVTLYQRFAGSDGLPTMLRPVFFLFVAAPSVASLAWVSIAGSVDTPSKMLFFLSLFLFTSLVCRLGMFKSSMKKFNVAWWAYSFPLTVLALASAEYAGEVKDGIANWLMLALSVLSTLVFLGLMVSTALHSGDLLPEDDAFTATLDTSSSS